MTELMNLLKNQVNQITTTRFSISDIEQTELMEMLKQCYHAEVVKRRMDFVCDKATEERLQKAAKWLSGKYKPGLLLYGASCGTGKTTLANAMCNLVNYLFSSCFSSERKVMYRVTAIDLVKFYSESPDRYKNLVNQELLFIDDIGTEPASVKIYGNEFSPVTELLYTRYDRQSWTLVTSNLSEDQLRERYGTRIDDRMREVFERIHFQGKSYRK